MLGDLGWNMARRIAGDSCRMRRTDISIVEILGRRLKELPNLLGIRVTYVRRLNVL